MALSVNVYVCVFVCVGWEEPGANHVPVDQAGVVRCLPEVGQGGIWRPRDDQHPQWPGLEAWHRPLQQVGNKRQMSKHKTGKKERKDKQIETDREVERKLCECEWK